jgi:hypothetical protein
MIYCNTTTDLYRAYPRVEELKSQKSLVGFEYSSDGYYVGNTGYVEVVYIDGKPLTKADILEELDSDSFFYDADRDVLYVGDSDVTQKQVYGGADWSGMKTWAVDAGSRDVDALLDGRFPTPLPESPYVEDGKRYDSDVVLAAAKFAVAHLANRHEPMRFGESPNLAGLLYEGAVKIINEYNDAKRRFSWEISPDEVGTAKIIASDITGSGMIQVRGAYTGESEAFWKIRIKTAGAVGTATYEVSTDNGVSYSGNYETSHLWSSGGAGIDVRFFDRGGEFKANDVWQLQLYPAHYQSRRGLIGSANIKMA